MGDSVGFAIRVENRYKGLRSPHKLKGGVSGCVRECAEAQGKDFGLIATEQGYNLYVCGNGGAKPRHADLLAGDLDEETCIRYLDRFLMYYDTTADRLTLNFGLRAESEYVPSFSDLPEYKGVRPIDFAFGDKLAPRLGFMF